MIRVAAIGTASTGKSAVLNALFGTKFAVDPRAGSTAAPERARAVLLGSELELIDMPPLPAFPDADVFLLVCDKDLTEPEYAAAIRVERSGRELGVALNKSDTYGATEMASLLGNIRGRLSGARVVGCAADPVRLVHAEVPDGSVAERLLPAQPDVTDLRILTRDLVTAAETSVRVRARELGLLTRGKLVLCPTNS